MNKKLEKFVMTATEKQMDDLIENLQKENPNSKEIDYTTQCWGHSFDPLNEHGDWVISGLGFYNGFGKGSLKIGDYILLKLVSGNIGKYIIIDLERMKDPKDMFDASVVLIGYKN